MAGPPGSAAAALAAAAPNACDAMAFCVTPTHADGLRARTAWARVLRRARAGGGGGGRAPSAPPAPSLAPDFDPATLTAGQVSHLAALIDEQLLGGQLARLTAPPGRPPLSFGVEDAGERVRCGARRRGGAAHPPGQRVIRSRGPQQRGHGPALSPRPPPLPLPRSRSLQGVTASYQPLANRVVVFRAALGAPAPGLARPVQIGGVYALSRWAGDRRRRGEGGEAARQVG
jgi:hypothetical protein